MAQTSLISCLSALCLFGYCSADVQCPKVTVLTEPCPPCGSGAICEEKGGDFLKVPEYLTHFSKLSAHQHTTADQSRIGVYRHAIASNAESLAGKVVMDVGAGTGILSFLAAQAGAGQVHAVEPTAAAETLRVVAASPGNAEWGSRVQTHAGFLEDVRLPPASVDALVSELGNMLFTELPILTAYLQARDRFLKPGGLMFPQTGDILVVPFSRVETRQSTLEPLQNAWYSGSYDIDWSAALPEALAQSLRLPIVGASDPESYVGEPFRFEFDFRILPVEKLQNLQMTFRKNITEDTVLHGLTTWFEIGFPNNTDLSGFSPPSLYWKETTLLLRTPLPVSAGDEMKGEVRMRAEEGTQIAVFRMCVGGDGSDKAQKCAESERINLM